MTTGSKKNQQKAAEYTDKAVAALQPKSYSDPYGTFKNGVFTPNLSTQQTQNLSGYDLGINNAVNQLPKSFNVNDYYNNSFYNDTFNALAAKLNQQRTQDFSDLNDNLNAIGQLGSSYDAKQRSQLYQNYDDQYAQASEAGRQASANAYQQIYKTALDKMSSLAALKGDMLNQIYQPMANALDYQNRVSGLQLGQASQYSQMAQNWWNRKTALDNTLDMYSSLASAVGSVIPSLGKGSSNVSIPANGPGNATPLPPTYDINPMMLPSMNYKI